MLRPVSFSLSHHVRHHFPCTPYKVTPSISLHTTIMQASPRSYTNTSFGGLKVFYRPMSNAGVITTHPLTANIQKAAYATRTSTPSSKHGRMERTIPPKKMSAVYRKWRSEGRNLTILLRAEFLQLAVRHAWEHPTEMMAFAEEVLRDVHTDKLEALAVLYTMAIQVCARAGEVERAFRVFKEMPKNKVQPDYMTYMALIRACALRDMEDRARTMYDEMLQLPSDVLPPEREGVTFELMYKSLKTL